MWQPFKTAPKDGTEFLVRYPLQGGVKQLVNWNTIHGYWQSKGEHVPGIESQKCEWLPIPNFETGEAGMYSVFDPAYPQVKVGDFTICRQSAESVWIQQECGEGGEFHDSIFEPAIAAFWKDHF